MQRTILNIAGVSVMAAGLAFGQSSSAPAAKPNGNHTGSMVDRLSADLNLTDAQKKQAQDIFGSERQSIQPVQEQIRTQRRALAQAVKSGASDAEIDRIANSMGPLVAQSAAARTKAMTRFYATLTPEQKVKMDQKLDHMMSGGPGWQSRRRQMQPHAGKPAVE